MVVKKIKLNWRKFIGSVGMFLIASVALTQELTLADPTIFYENNTFYISGTNSDNGFYMYESKDLIFWRLSGFDSTGMILKKGESVYGDKWFWAPQFFKDGNAYHLIYTANEQLAIASSSKINGKYEQNVVEPIDPSAKNIDPFLFKDDDGKYYLFHVRFQNGNNIWVAEFNMATKKIIPSTLKQCFGRTQSWEKTSATPSADVIEGPTVFKKDGIYYMLYSANHFESPDYAVGYATTTDIRGRWTKYEGNPIIHRSIVGENGSGHGDLFFDGNENPYYVFHVHNSSTKVGPRKTRIVPLQFTYNDNTKKYDISIKKNLIIIPKIGNSNLINLGVGYEFDIQRGDFAVGDINNDLYLDIIFSGEDNGGNEKGAILINDQEGNFINQRGDRIIRMGKSGNIKFGDIDGDGDLDVIFAGWGTAQSSVGIALNDGNGNFTLANETQYPINKAEKVTSAGFADFNLDGLLDYYYFGDGTGNCILYFQQSNGSFNASTESFGNFNFKEPEVTVVDYNNDGCPDIFISAFDNTTASLFSTLFTNNGTGKFQIAENFEVYRQKANGSTSWADFNGDGYIDFLLNGDGDSKSGENNNGIVRVYKNQNGTTVSEGAAFEWYRQNGVGNGSMAVDWDNDGKMDFFVGGWNDQSKKQETALYLNSNPDNFGFTKSILSNYYFPGISEQGFMVADLNDDFKVDLLLCGYSGGNMNLNRRIAGYIKNTSSNASTPPNAPTALNASIDEEKKTVSFSWDPPLSENGKHGTTYNFALKNITTDKWLYNPMAVIGGDMDGWRKVAGRMGNVYANTNFKLNNLPDGKYEWTVQAINGSYFGGSFAASKTFTIATSGINHPKTIDPVIYVEDGYLIISTHQINSQIRVYNTHGQEVVNLLSVDELKIELTKGIYIVEVVNQSVYKTKVIVQ
ncbi:MAG TPA: family 43 glycosylhydrolase [Paludibacter sp.]|nr:MAG: Beta-xylosidase [Bacteroidetes bacterium ADurb.Bin174]HQB27488.1 family 43 glycosylhydrolase [Paludibacter sp.]